MLDVPITQTTEVT